MSDFQKYLEASSARHSHLCPRQILGVRAALAAAKNLDLRVPRRDKRLFVISETDGCFVDGLEVVTGATVGHRTLRVEDLGKIAATFVDVKHNISIRVAPRRDLRDRAWVYVAGEKRHYFAQLQAYQVMPEEEMFSIQQVELITPIEEVISRAGIRAECDICGEEIINGREIFVHGSNLCRTCAGSAYYTIIEHNPFLAGEIKRAD
jgi:formylmethanofuran dehydrogenase subunit E